MKRDPLVIEQIDNAFFACSDDFDELAESFNAYEVKDAFLEFISSFMKNFSKYIV